MSTKDMSGWERHSSAKKTKATPPKPKAKRTATTPKKSTKRTKSTKSVDVFEIDTREPVTMHGQFDIFKEPFKIRTLQFGDYRYVKCLAERKTIFDFVGSFRNTRVFTQLEGLVEEDCHPFLIITGSLEKLQDDVHFKHINVNTVIGALGSCICRYGINVIWVRTDTDAVLVMKLLFKQMSAKGFKKPGGELPNNFLMLSGTLSDLQKMSKLDRSEVIKSVAEIICNERVNVLWCYDNTLGLKVTSRMFHKINEGKQGMPRKRMLKKDAGGRTENLVRNYLRIEPALAKSLTAAARKKKLGVMKYIMETPNYVLLSHSGMGNVTLARLRALVG